MKRQLSFHNNDCRLYLVATPIGNLGDITYRALEILKTVDYIYAEDTRVSLVLLNHYGIKTPLFSYHEFNEEIKTKEIINYIKNGKNVALISDAGLPVISDPGFTIVKEARECGIAVSPVPGASAGVSALIASGIAPLPYTFYGFLDSKKTARCKSLENLKQVNHTLIFYEAPHRIKQTLEDMLLVLGDRQIAIGRELTKKFEEFITGSISEIIPRCEGLKGEMVIVVSGSIKKQLSEEEIIKEVIDLIDLGVSPNMAIKKVSSTYNTNKNQVYKCYIDYKNK